MSYGADGGVGRRERESGDFQGARPGPRWITVLLTVAAVVFAALLALSLSFGGALLPPSTSNPPQILTLTGIDRSIVYLNGTTGAIGPAVNDSCPQCPISFSAGSMVTVTILTFRVNTTYSQVAIQVFLSSTIPFVPLGIGCATSCAPVRSSSEGWILSNGLGIGAPVTFAPPQNASLADSGGVSLVVEVTTCSTVDTAWNFCG